MTYNQQETICFDRFVEFIQTIVPSNLLSLVEEALRKCYLYIDNSLFSELGSDIVRSLLSLIKEKSTKFSSFSNGEECSLDDLYRFLSLQLTKGSTETFRESPVYRSLKSTYKTEAVDYVYGYILQNIAAIIRNRLSRFQHLLPYVSIPKKLAHFIGSFFSTFPETCSLQERFEALKDHFEENVEKLLSESRQQAIEKLWKEKEYKLETLHSPVMLDFLSYVTYVVYPIVTENYESLWLIPDNNFLKTTQGYLIWEVLKGEDEEQKTQTEQVLQDVLTLEKLLYSDSLAKVLGTIPSSTLKNMMITLMYNPSELPLASSQTVTQRKKTTGNSQSICHIFYKYSPLVDKCSITWRDIRQLESFKTLLQEIVKNELVPANVKHKILSDEPIVDFSEIDNVINVLVKKGHRLHLQELVFEFVSLLIKRVTSEAK